MADNALRENDFEAWRLFFDNEFLNELSSSKTKIVSANSWGDSGLTIKPDVDSLIIEVASPSGIDIIIGSPIPMLSKILEGTTDLNNGTSLREIRETSHRDQTLGISLLGCLGIEIPVQELGD